MEVKEATKSALLTALMATLDKLRQLSERGNLPQEGHWEYNRDAHGQWSGQIVQKPSFITMFSILDTGEGKSHVAVIGAALKKDYPEYLELVGTPTMQVALQPSGLLASLVRAAYERFASFTPNSEQIDSLLEDASKFFGRKTITLRLYAPALNLHGPKEMPPIDLLTGVTLRAITDEEFTKFYGGNAMFQMQAIPLAFPDFVFVKEIEIEKVFGAPPTSRKDPVVNPFKEELDRCMLILSTFKDAGAVGYDGIWITPAEWTPGALFGGQRVFFNEHVPHSSYEIAPAEASMIQVHAKRFNRLHQTLEMASQRLLDSARRSKPRDALVDAVIGLESILLSNTGDRTELRFRFALHYAALLPRESRRDAFDTLRDLYDIRSAIAHGNFLKKELKINGRMVQMSEAATIARSILRKTINMFIPDGEKPAFMSKDYWTSKALSL